MRHQSVASTEGFPTDVTLVFLDGRWLIAVHLSSWETQKSRMDDPRVTVDTKRKRRRR